MNWEPDVIEAIKTAISEIGKDLPEIYEIFQSAKMNGLTEEEAMAKMAIALHNPTTAAKVEQVLMKALSPLQDDEVRDLVPQDDDGGPSILFDSGVGLSRMNPLYEASLIERLQFDEDIPELRTGPLPPNTPPAVSVDTKARNPIAVGLMLEQGSDDVLEEVIEHRRKHLSAIDEKINFSDKTDLVPSSDKSDLVSLIRGDASSDPPSYRRGEVPALYWVDTPTGSSLASLGPKETRQKAWKAISTTQGRRTMSQGIANLVREYLYVKGVEVTISSKRDGSGVIANAEWVIGLGEQGTTQENYSLVDVAARSLAEGLMGSLDLDGSENFSLLVEPINDIPNRRVGWKAELR